MKVIVKGLLAGLLTITGVLPSIGTGEAVASFKFKDVPANHWAKDAIYKAVNKGYFKGYSDGTFRPNAKVTRAEFAALMARVSNNPTTQGLENFSDLKGHWAESAVAKAIGMGFISKKDYPNGFKPGTALTRREMAKWMASGLAANKEDFKQALSDTKDTLVPVAEYFKGSLNKSDYPYISVVLGTGLMAGYPDGSFGPNKTTTRAEAAVILARYEKVSTKSAESFADLNELRMVGTKKTNLELVTPFTTGNTSFTDISGKKKSFRNGAGNLVFHRLIAVNTQNWNDKKSVYAPFFVDDSDKNFLTKHKGLYPVFMQITIYPKSKQFDVDHYYNGVYDFLSASPITNDLPNKFGYFTLPRMYTKEFFKNRPNGVTVWVTKNMDDNGRVGGQIDMDDGSVVYFSRKK
ncbi:S-layer homology domain-containing protein [Paenibacillus faecalis]|uniref:S-layer homology domain-containing protein n=1 Tax=Paenibacillus faecalis TaxID=2079532 RepID=UPI000D11215B|nr:S-layer homology domain-containing protein [Paenibacillus faecalis]